MSALGLRNRLFHSLQGDRGAVAMLVVTFFGLNRRLLTGRVSEQWDGEIFFAPFYHYIASLARCGHLLYWNPFSSGGSPDFAEPQIGAFSPVTLLFGLLAGPGPFGFHLYWLCLWLLGGLGMYVLARALSAPPWGALVSALGFVLSGFYLGHGEHLSVIYTYSFVPWVLWRVRAALTTGRRWPACEAGALWGLSALAGNPAVHIPAALFIGLVSLAWLPPLPPGSSRWLLGRRYALTMTLLAGVGVLVLAPAYLSFRYEVAGYSHRTLPLPRSVVLDQKFGWSWLTALATPAFVSLDDAVPAWEEFDISLRPIYFGAVVPILAAFALWRRRKRWRTWVIFGAGLLCLGVSLGASSPLHAWLYDWVPPTRFFRHAPMFRGFFILTMCMLAASGSAFVENRRRETAAERNLRPLLVAAGMCAGVSLAACIALNFSVPNEIWAQIPLLAIGHVMFAWLGPVALCALAMKWPAIRRGLPGALVALTAVDLAVAHGFTSRVAFRPQPSAVVTGSVEPLTDLGSDGFARAAGESVNANLYTRQPVFASYTAMRNELQARWAADDQLRPYVLGPRRVWFAADVPAVPATPEAFDAFAQRARQIGALPVVRQTRESLLRPDTIPTVAEAIAAAPAAQALDYRLLAYHDNDLALQVTCPGDGYLLITDRWSRSWQATVNGRTVPIDGGDFLFRLVPVRAGSNLVTMRFHVPWLPALIALSWGTLAVIGTAALCSRWQRRRAKESVGVRRAGTLPVPVGAVGV